MDTRVLGAAVLLGLITTIALASVTARQSMRVAVISALKGEDVAARLWFARV